MGWVLRFGGLAALAAAFFTWRIDEEGDGRRRYQRVSMNGGEGTAEEGEGLRDGGDETV